MTSIDAILTGHRGIQVIARFSYHPTLVEVIPISFNVIEQRKGANIQHEQPSSYICTPRRVAEVPVRHDFSTFFGLYQQDGQLARSCHPSERQEYVPCRPGRSICH
jgi:hypothetical protein